MRILLSTWRKEVKIKLVVKSLLANVKNNDKEILRVVRLLYRALSPSHSNKWIELVACHAANSLRNIHFRFPYLSIYLFLASFDAHSTHQLDTERSKEKHADIVRAH